MKTIRIQRVSYRPEVTLGVLYDADSDLMYATLEKPDLDNHPETSCIPLGNYICIPHNTDKWKNVWEITNVPNRTGILLHSGNTVNDISGCLLIGRSFGRLKGKSAVLSSQIAYEGFRKHIGVGNEFNLIIERV